MLSKTLFLTAVLLATSLATACEAEEKSMPIELGDSHARLVQGNTQFALDLYQQLRDQEGNLFLAPHSISTALAMTYAGARGETAAQMAAVLHYALEQDALHPTFAELLAAQAVAEPNSCELYQANALWGQEGYKFLQPFLKLVESNYGGGLQRLDFAGATEEARAEINAWIAERTRDRIKELLQKGDIDAATALVLTNAIYFKGKWASPFDADLTASAPFFTSAEAEVQADFMMQTGDFPYARLDGVQLLELPYVGAELSMVLLLPNEREGLADLEKTLTAERLAEWLEALDEHLVRVQVPRFAMSTRFDLAETLEALGMTDAFQGNVADFSGMNGNRELFISAVITEANIDVTEEGTEAAGATAVVMKRAAMPPLFKADHPFLFLIRHHESGSVLFLGRVADPSA